MASVLYITKYLPSRLENGCICKTVDDWFLPGNGPSAWTAYFLLEENHAAFFLGTLAPLRRASESPMAMACLRLFTLPPLPDFSLPRFSLCISFSTLFCALGLYLRPLERARPRDELVRREREE